VSQERVAQIRTLLEREMAPEALEVIDESHLHVGHAGARDGRGHFRIRITSSRFAGRPRLARHRMIYQALGGMMTTDIHALSIEADSGNE
jgi:BolA family transcriptional regulator, general stress-responsive regulator